MALQKSLQSSSFLGSTSLAVPQRGRGLITQKPCHVAVSKTSPPLAVRSMLVAEVAQETETVASRSGVMIEKDGWSVSSMRSCLIQRETQKQIADKNDPTGPIGKAVKQFGVKSPVGGILSAVLDMVENLIPLIEPRERTFSTDPVIQLAGNFAPVDESPPAEVIEVVGTIPSCMSGVYLRNGGNPQHTPTAGFHNFDGDSMLHAVRIKDGKASHCCRYTRTNRFIQEERAGRPLFSKILGEMSGLGGLARLALVFARGSLGILDHTKGMGVANAGLAFFNGKLLAMSEDDMPYVVHVAENGDLETIGRYDFNGALQNAMTAHPKVDPVTGEMFAFSYNLMKQPHLSYFRVSPTGEKGVDVPISLSEPTVMHDFAVTKNYAIFPEIQMVFRLQELFNGKSPICCDEKKMSRYGVLPRNDHSQERIQWFDLPDSTCFHYINAWEEGDEVVIVGSCLSPLAQTFEQPQNLHNDLTLLRLNLKTGKARKQQISNANIDCGQYNTLYTSQKTRYMYLSISGPWPRYSGIAKVDLEAQPVSSSAQVCDDSSIVGWRKYSPGCFGSEPFFVPRSTEPGIAEDDGYVVTHYHDENTGISELLILDAQSPTLELVASLKMPSRVPYGFHGIFLSEQQLASQQPTLYDKGFIMFLSSFFGRLDGLWNIECNRDWTLREHCNFCDTFEVLQQLERIDRIGDGSQD